MRVSDVVALGGDDLAFDAVGTLDLTDHDLNGFAPGSFSMREPALRASGEVLQLFCMSLDLWRVHRSAFALMCCGGGSSTFQCDTVVVGVWLLWVLSRGVEMLEGCKSPFQEGGPVHIVRFSLVSIGKAGNWSRGRVVELGEGLGFGMTNSS